MADIFGDNDPNFLIGTAGGDRLFGLGGNDVLYGLGGNDVLAGGAGGDYLHGGDGLDYADYGGSGGAVLVNLATGSAAGGDAFGDTLVSIEAVFGSQSGDWLIGNNDFNILYGGGGNDLIQGGGGSDSLAGESGDDTLEGGDGNDTLQGGAGGDLLDGGAGIDLVSYLASPTGVIVNLLANTAAGGHAFGDSFVSIENVGGSQAQDLITGSAEANSLFGHCGNDVIDGRGGHDTLVGGDGDDNLSGGGGNDFLVGDFGSDTLFGSTGRDTMLGGVGNDFLSGENGPDLLTGGSGGDTLRGGAGADLFIYTGLGDSPTGYVRNYRDVIQDFSRAELDRIDLSAIDAVAGTPGNQAFTFIGAAGFGAVAGQLRYKLVNGITCVQVDVDGNGTSDFQINLTGEIALAASDFVL